jgi:hypothetical protein
MTTFYENDQSEITALLLGRTVTVVGEDTLTLDDGRTLVLAGHEGGCSCGAGDYYLVDLNGCPNVITKVEFVDSPTGDDEDGDGYYRIFVFAGDDRINLATFEGTDGNGYYGTGYSIAVATPDPA